MTLTLPPLYHFTCAHMAAEVERTGYIRPRASALLPFAWFTDLEVPDVQGLGLTSMILKCDRTEVRFQVDPAHAESAVLPWGRVRRSVRPDTVDGLELALGALPRHWYVSVGRVPLMGYTLPQEDTFQVPADCPLVAP